MGACPILNDGMPVALSGRDVGQIGSTHCGRLSNCGIVADRLAESLLRQDAPASEEQRARERPYHDPAEPEQFDAAQGALCRAFPLLVQTERPDAMLDKLFLEALGALTILPSTNEDWPDPKDRLYGSFSRYPRACGYYPGCYPELYCKAQVPLSR